uniref:Uncharacterized protein n=1 Tax=Strigops habroptila TaxID=2489341 RepID=A0A672U3F5_STRHB
MEHSCSLLLLCVSFLFAQALPPNGTELPKPTATTNSTEENHLHKDLLTSMLILLLVFIIFILLAGYFFRFRRHRKAVVNSGDKKMPNGILEEQEQQRVMLLSRSPSGPKKYFPIPVENLEEEIRMRSADEGKLFREEFNVSSHLWSENGGKCRHLQILITLLRVFGA